MRLPSRNSVFLIGTLILTLINRLQGATNSCPNMCSCNIDEQTVDCSGASLDRIPHGIARNTRILILSNNSIPNFTPGDFRGIGKRLEVLRIANNSLTTLDGSWLRGLTKLNELDLSDNQIERIELLAFNVSSNLQTLKLRNNRLSSLSDGAFWGLTTLKKLNLDNNNIESVRLNWTFGLLSLQELSLKHNNIQEISAKSFNDMKRLNKLLLSGNHLRRLDSGIFSGLMNLESLRLADNDIEYLDENLFGELGSLKLLDLSNNSLSWSFERIRGMFTNLHKLNKLRLNNNKIRLIHSNTFDGIESLKELDLSHNPLTTIEPEAFERLKNLEKLNLNSSSLFCDCSILPFVEWLRSSDRRKSFAKNVHCSFPDRLRDKTRRSIFGAQSSDFDCSDHRRPVLMDNFKAFVKPLVAIKHKNILFYCKVASSLNIKFSWIKNNQLIESFDNHPKIVSKTLSAPNNDNSTLFTNIISVSDVDDDDDGQYQCVASNEFGVVYSHPFRVNVFIPPMMVKTPMNVTAKLGSTVRWNCSATGRPQPQITWNKSGKFVAGDERRLRFDGDMFFIINVTKEDSGNYSCTASNDAGDNVSTVSLKVVQPATFVRTSPDVISAELGTHASLECIAVGLPTPTIQWFRNGTPLVRTQRHFFTHQDQFLLIVPLQNDDAGKYSCEARNEYGFEEIHFNLKPIPKRETESVPQNSNVYDFIKKHALNFCIVVLVILLTSMLWLALFVFFHRPRKTRSNNRNNNNNMKNIDRNLNEDLLEDHHHGRHHLNGQRKTFTPQIEDYQSDSSRDTGVESSSTNDHMAMSIRNHRLYSGINTMTLQHPTIHNKSMRTNSLSRLNHLQHYTLSSRNRIHDSHRHYQQSYSHSPIAPVTLGNMVQHPQHYTTLPKLHPYSDHNSEASMNRRHSQLSRNHNNFVSHSQEIILEQHHLQSTPKPRSSSRSTSHPQQPQQQQQPNQDKIETEI